MSSVTLSYRGDFSKTTQFLEKGLNLINLSVFDKYGKEGVERLKEATPKDTGLTSESWTYKISKTKSSITISWWNSNIQNGVPVALVLQYGHVTGWGGYVSGIDYINPALKPVFDDLSKRIFKEAFN